MELELKVAVDSHEAVRSGLNERGVFIGRVLETNRLLDRPDQSLKKSGCGLRVRSTRLLEGGASPGTVTFKGPLQSSAYKHREEIETEVKDPGAMLALLTRLGFAEFLVFEKLRESWRMDRCKVELDELPILGLFVEIEGPDEAAIRAAAEQLELSRLPVIRESYVAMLARNAQPRADGVIDVKFGRTA